MAYLGNVPARSFISFERQVFTIVNSQTAYTLSHSVTNENDIRLVVNNIVQEPGSGKAYTASGTTLTLSAALTNGTDEMYCVFLGRAVGTVNAPAGSVGTSQLVDLNVTTGKIAADAVNGDKIADDSISDEHLDPTAITGQTAETSIATDDLILLSDTSASGALKKMTRANFVSGVGGVNTPAFQARLSGNYTLANDTTTVLPLATDNSSPRSFDTNGAFDTSTYKFTVPSGQGGKYFLYATARWDEPITSDRCAIDIEVNNSSVGINGENQGAHQYFTVSASGAAVLSAGDYVTLKAFQDSGSSKTVRSDVTFLGGYKIIE